MIWLEALVFCMTWAGCWLLVDGLSHRTRPDLAERLLPFSEPSVGDEAERWLQNQK